MQLRFNATLLPHQTTPRALCEHTGSLSTQPQSLAGHCDEAHADQSGSGSVAVSGHGDLPSGVMQRGRLLKTNYRDAAADA